MMSETDNLLPPEDGTPFTHCSTAPLNLVVDATTQAGPVFLLAPPRSFTSVICAMLGQHPQLYGLPEMQLFGAETMKDWRKVCKRASFPMAHGLLRAVAQLYFGQQTEESIRLANGWLRRRANFTTGLIFEALAEKAAPRILVEKSPSIVYHMKFMQRAFSMFPQARFLHLTRHPRGYTDSVIKAINEAAQYGPVPYWLLKLGSFPETAEEENSRAALAFELDPQRSWYILQMKISEFLTRVPDQQKLQLRGEDILTEPDSYLRQIAAWLGLRTDPAAIDEMKHPERSPYACFGPPSAYLGNDSYFLQSPTLRPDRAEPQSLNGPLSWREDGQEFSFEVKQLARQFGYQ